MGVFFAFPHRRRCWKGKRGEEQMEETEKKEGKKGKNGKGKKKLSLTSPTQSPRLLRSTLTALPPRDSITSSVPDFTM